MNEADTPERKIPLARMFGTAPWLKTKEVRHYRAKVFKSGNSLALRLPAGIGLAAGMETDLRVEDGGYFSFEPIVSPKREFDIESIWGSAPGLELIADEDRVFEQIDRQWDDPDGDDVK